MYVLCPSETGRRGREFPESSPLAGQYQGKNYSICWTRKMAQQLKVLTSGLATSIPRALLVEGENPFPCVAL